MSYPQRLLEIVEDMKSITDRMERTELLIELADRFAEVRVPQTVASQPYDETHRAPACESEAFVWAVDQPDGTLQFYFDVLNPQGLSAMAFTVILADSINGAPVEQIVNIGDDVIYDIYGKELSMGKSMGLNGILTLVRKEARQRLAG